MLLELFVTVPSEAVPLVEAPSVDALLAESPPDVTATEDAKGSALETWLAPVPSLPVPEPPVLELPVLEPAPWSSPFLVLLVEPCWPW